MCGVCDTMNPAFFPLCTISPVVGSALVLASPLMFWNQQYLTGIGMIGAGGIIFAFSPLLIPIGVIGCVCHFSSWNCEELDV